MATLLHEYDKDDQAEMVSQGELNLNDCQIGDFGAEIVGWFLEHVEIETVKVHGCGVTPRGTKAIANALESGKTITHLNIENNQLGNEGAEMLIGALAYNTRITLLFVSGNGIAPALAATIGYLVQTRNAILIPTIVCRASLFLIAARRNIAETGILSILPEKVVKMIAMKVYATRKDPVWIKAVSGPDYLTQQRDSIATKQREIERERFDSDFEFYSESDSSLESESESEGDFDSDSELGSDFDCI